MDTTQLASIVEAILFVANGSVSTAQLQKLLGVEADAVREAVQLVADKHARGGLRLQCKGNDLQLVTAPEAAPYVEKFLNIEVTGKLSPAALETLAIVAYREPVTRAQVEAIRGVNSDGVLGTLLMKGLIQEAGRLDTVGHPILYKTTFQFLQQFGLKSTDELPPLEETPPNGQSLEDTAAPA